MAVEIDRILHQGRRSLRTLPQTLLLGPTGARLWANFLYPRPGFSGCLDFIHKTNLPLLFAVDCDAVKSYEPCRIDWYPSHLKMTYVGNGIDMAEEKFITWDDCAVSCQTWINKGSETITLKLSAADFFQKTGNGCAYRGSRFIPEHQFDIQAVLLAADIWKSGEMHLEPGEKAEFSIAAAFGLKETDSMEALRNRARRYVGSNTDFKAIVSGQVKQYQKWFDKVPDFHSGDPLLDKTWAYRWFILRHNLSDPRAGNLPYPLFYEGRSHKKAKTPYHPGGWEFSKLITLSVPLHITDAEWYPDDSCCMGELLDTMKGQDEDGLYHCLFADRSVAAYANFIGWASYRLYLTSRNPKILTDVLPSLKKQVKGWQTAYGNPHDALMTEWNHKRTGKEYQPSYWYFTGFPDDCMNKKQITPLKRVDLSVYFYLNVLGVAKLCSIAGDKDAEKFEALAVKVKSDVLSMMWDEKTQFFYDLHYQTNEKAMVKNIVGFYPYWARMTDSKYGAGMKHLFSKEFNTACPFPSVSTDCPVFQAEGGWKGRFIKGRNGCVWDGPSWPYTTCIALAALANESRARGHQYDREFGNFLRKYSLEHYWANDLSRPCLVEHYNSLTGEPISDEADYNHSFYIDLIVRNLAGLHVGRNRFVFDPLDIGLDYFVLDNLHAAGRNIRITYRKPGCVRCGQSIEEGYNVYIDEKKSLSNPKLTKMEYWLDENRI